MAPVSWPDSGYSFGYSDNEVLEWLEDPRSVRMTEGAYRPMVIRCPTGMVVKRAGRILHREALMQQHMFKLLDRSRLRVPEVYHYFDAGWYGHIVMEHIDDWHPMTIDDVDKVAEALRYLHTFTSNVVGHIDGGPSYGYLWDEQPKRPFRDQLQLQQFLESRLEFAEGHVDLMQYPLVMCHLDLHPENISIGKKGVVCFIDWAFSGYYPRYFESTALGYNCNVNHDLGRKCFALLDAIHEITPFTEQERQQILLHGEIVFNQISRG